MKRLICVLMLTAAAIQAQVPDYDRFFNGKTLRIDFYLTGNAQEINLIFDALVAEGPWPGSPLRLIDGDNRGAYRHELLEAETGQLIYASEMVSLFAEYAITPPALEGRVRALHHSVRVPMPKGVVRWVVKRRDQRNQWVEFYSQTITPDDQDMRRDPLPSRIEVVDVEINGPAATKVDLCFLGEGYRAEDRALFETHLRQSMEQLFSAAPFGRHRQRFNVRGVFVHSEDAGIDDPAKGRFVRTAFDATYRTLGMDHYLGTENNRAVRDAAAAADYDVLLIMVNDPGYGGNGIYNWFTMFTAGSPMSDLLLLHELGHGFGGLADEYYGDYDSKLTAEAYYRPGVEPIEPNVCRLIDGKVKWAKLLSPGVAVPTPWGQTELDSLDQLLFAMGREARAALDSLTRSGADATAIESERQTWRGKRRALFDSAREIRMTRLAELRDVVGVFEGAAHIPKGVYRSAMDCLMNRGLDKTFCPVCQKAFEDRINFYAPPEK